MKKNKNILEALRIKLVLLSKLKDEIESMEGEWKLVIDSEIKEIQKALGTIFKLEHVVYGDEDEN